MRKIKGFTLIELLVVISIISLLSSIVLSSLQDTRDKAAAAVFQSEMNSLIIALELYKSENGIYPHEDYAVSNSNIYNFNNLNDNTETANSGADLLSTFLADYIPNLPKVPNPGTAIAGWAYRTNYGNATHYRCNGSTELPPYVILVYSNNDLVYDAVEGWPISEYSNAPYSTWTDTASSRCYSP